jgi:hypothetical protein
MRNKWRLGLGFFLSFISSVNLIGQCNVPNGDFKNSFINNNKLHPNEWKIYGKYIWIYDDNKPFMLKRDGKPRYIYTRDLFEPRDTTTKQILAMLSEIPKHGRRYKHSASVKLTEMLMRDSLYEISIDISFKSNNVFAYKYYPIFFTATPTYNKKKEIQVELYNTDKALIRDGSWYTLKTLYKANGTESYLNLTDDFDYSKFWEIIDTKKCNMSNLYKYSVCFDNICIKKIHRVE